MYFFSHFKSEQYIENLQNQSNILQIETKLQNDIAKLIDIKDKIQIRIGEKLDKIKNIKSINNHDKIHAREIFISNLESGLKSKQSYIDILNEKQTKDVNKLASLNTELNNTMNRCIDMKDLMKNS